MSSAAVTSSSSASSLLLIITGASRGLGRAISVAFCQDLSIGRIHALLVARSEDGLNETTDLMTQVASNRVTPFPLLQLQVTQHAMDLSNLDQLDPNIDTLLQSMPAPFTSATTSSSLSSSSAFDRIVLINNAGSLGHVGPTLNSPSLQDMKQAVDLNVTSSLWWSVRMARHFVPTPTHPTTIAPTPTTKVTLVNISSLVALQDFPTMAIYSAGKAARDRFHSVLAVEESNNIDQHMNVLKVLNYAPGPLETDMSVTLRHCKELDETLKPHYQKELIDPLDSARKLVQVVLKDEFQTGQHLDYYDF